MTTFSKHFWGPWPLSPPLATPMIAMLPQVWTILY